MLCEFQRGVGGARPPLNPPLYIYLVNRFHRGHAAYILLYTYQLAIQEYIGRVLLLYTYQLAIQEYIGRVTGFMKAIQAAVVQHSRRRGGNSGFSKPASTVEPNLTYILHYTKQSLDLPIQVQWNFFLIFSVSPLIHVKFKKNTLEFHISKNILKMIKTKKPITPNFVLYIDTHLYTLVCRFHVNKEVY